MTYSDIFDDEFTPHPKVMKFTFVPERPRMPTKKPEVRKAEPVRSEKEAPDGMERLAKSDSRTEDMLPAVKPAQYAVKKNILGKLVAKEIKR